MPHFGTFTKGRKPASMLVIDGVGQSQPALNTTNAPIASGPSFAVQANQQGGVGLPMIMATIMVFMQLGRPFDQFLIGLHFPTIIAGIGIVVMLFTPWMATLKTPTGTLLILFLGIMCAASVFSIWRGGSFAFVQQYVELNIVVFCLLAAAPKTVGQVRWLAIVALFSNFFDVAVGAGFDEQGRLYLTDATFGNSDDVALLGGICIPLVILFASRLGKVFGTIIGAAGVVACLALVELSAARFALISLTVMAIIYFFRAGGAQRIALILCFCTLVVGSMFLLPKSTVTRLSTITSFWNSDDEIAGASTNEAIGSMRERQQLSKDAIQAFLTHPILGVGPDVFVDWRFDVLHRRGQPAHDTYLQAAAEDGILGVVFYTAFLIAAYLALQRCAKTFVGWEKRRPVALALQQCLVYFAVSAFFINCISHAHQFVFAGLAVALDRLRQEQKEASEAVPETINEAEIPSAPKVRPVESTPARPRLETNTAPAPARPARYRFNRPISTSHND